MIGSIVVVDDVPNSFVELVAAEFLRRPLDGFSIAFSGGGTARECYERLAALPAGAIDWTKVEAYWGDERCVPPDDPDSNHRLVREALLDRVGPLAAVHPMDCGHGASAYEGLLAAAPPIDICHLGLGPDGHTASLFPQSAALESPARKLVVTNVDPLGHNPHERMTFTFSGIARCRMTIVTVEGEAKREAFRRVRDADPTAPASHIDGESVVWIVDRAALGSATDR
jgi:6-phosphogluconolactonase